MNEINDESSYLQWVVQWFIFKLWWKEMILFIALVPQMMSTVEVVLGPKRSLATDLPNNLTPSLPKCATEKCRPNGDTPPISPTKMRNWKSAPNSSQPRLPLKIHYFASILLELFSKHIFWNAVFLKKRPYSSFVGFFQTFVIARLKIMIWLNYIGGQVEQGVIAARFQKEVWNNVTRFDWQKFQDPDLRRRFRLLSVLGPSALPEDKLTEVIHS